MRSLAALKGNQLLFLSTQTRSATKCTRLPFLPSFYVAMMLARRRIFVCSQSYIGYRYDLSQLTSHCQALARQKRKQIICLDFRVASLFFVEIGWKSHVFPAGCPELCISDPIFFTRRVSGRQQGRGIFFLMFGRKRYKQKKQSCPRSFEEQLSRRFDTHIRGFLRPITAALKNRFKHELLPSFPHAFIPTKSDILECFCF